MSNAHNPKPDSGTVSAFADSPNGTLSSVTGSPFTDGQMAPCWVEITPDGQFLFTVITASQDRTSGRASSRRSSLLRLVVAIFGPCRDATHRNGMVAVRLAVVNSGLSRVAFPGNVVAVG